MADPLSAESLSDLHLEACAAAIRGFCRLESVTQEYVARAIGVTPVELSYVLHLRRQPGAKFLRGLEATTRLPAELREGLLEHLWAARRYRDEEERELLGRAGQVPLNVLLPGIEEQYALAGKGQLAEEKARRAHQHLYRQCATLTARLAWAKKDPLAFIRLCAVQIEVGCVLDRLYDSLAMALLAERVAEGLEGQDRRTGIREFYSPQTQIVRAKAVVYHNLHLYREAYDLCSRAEEMPVVRARPEVWLPHIVRDKLKAMAHLGRLSIREAEECARQGWDACASPAWDAGTAQVLSLLVDHSLVDCYLGHGNRADLAKAAGLARMHRDAIERNAIPGLAPLHKVMFYKALAEIERWEAARGRASAGEVPTEALRAAIATAGRAGLQNQLQKIRIGFGATALRLAQEEGIALA